MSYRIIRTHYLRFVAVAILATVYLAFCRPSFASTAGDARVLRLSSLSSDSGLGGHVLILEDPTASLGIDQVSSPHMDEAFHSMESDNLSLGFTNSHFWLKLTVAPDPANPDARWYLDPGWTYFSKLVFYAPDPAAAGSARPPCRMLWSNLSVHADGKVSACCHDSEDELIVGDLSKGETVRGIWEGSALARLRQIHREGRFEELPICHACRNQA